MTDKLHGSTGSKGPAAFSLTMPLSHDAQDSRHVVVIEGEGTADMPGTVPLQRIVIDGIHYTHVGDDDQGRWVYRKL